MHKLGVLLTNTGTPDAPTPQAVRRYLREFLADPHVVKIPRLLWLPILYGLILPLRSPKSAKLYQKIWLPNGAPLRLFMQEIRDQLLCVLNKEVSTYYVEVGMNYGSPCIREGLEKLKLQGAETYIILPLFPQYSNSTTESSIDRVMQVFNQWEWLPAFNLAHNYATHPLYIQALCQTLNPVDYQTNHRHLLISFHGVPQQFVNAGDPYQQQCIATATLIAEKLGLNNQQWTLCYQSKFGYAKWLTPSTQTLFETLSNDGIKNIDVICPGFAVDCLETLEEIAITGKETFLAAGGHSFRYISALNASPGQIDLFRDIITHKQKSFTNKDG